MALAFAVIAADDGDSDGGEDDDDCEDGTADNVLNRSQDITGYDNRLSTNRFIASTRGNRWEEC